MPFIEQIVQIINNSLKGGSLNKKALQPAVFNGVSSIIGRKNGAGQLELIPGSLDGSGNYKPIVPDGKFNLVIYHKILSNDYQNITKSYGDTNDMSCTSQMMMVVWCNGIKTKLTPEQIEAMTIFGMPQRLAPADLNKLGLKICKITPVSSNMDRLQCFRQEFQLVELFLKPNDAFFTVRYKIESTFGQACVDLCCE